MKIKVYSWLDESSVLCASVFMYCEGDEIHLASYCRGHATRRANAFAQGVAWAIRNYKGAEDTAEIEMVDEISP